MLLVISINVTFTLKVSSDGSGSIASGALLLKFIVHLWPRSLLRDVEQDLTGPVCI